MDTNKLLFEKADWNFSTIQNINDAVEEIAINELGLNVYPNQIEIINTEQMLDAYSSIGMPLFYKHWSFGKQFARNEVMYRTGMQGLAYEIVINANPCISYLMEENSATMQALVIAHAAYGHNHFFKNNYCFKQWTDAEGILDYLEFAKNYIMSCEEKYGMTEVENLLDASHALMNHGVFKFPKKRSASLKTEELREKNRREHDERTFNDLWRTVPGNENIHQAPSSLERRMALLELPQENILYFLEKVAPKLLPWQREILRIVRTIAQYFRPQMLTKVMNEGCATYVHYQIMNRLHEKGLIGDGSYLEFIKSHTNVVFQPEFDDPRYSGFNPYALGFAMMKDIERICNDPTEEDVEYFPSIAGCEDHMNVLKDIWANYRDESFILQYLSPNLIRKFKLFHVVDDANDPNLIVESIHNEQGYREIRRALSKHYDPDYFIPDIQISDVDLRGDRKLVIEHKTKNGVLLDQKEAELVLQHIANLWGYDVYMRETNPSDGSLLKSHTVQAQAGIIPLNGL